MQRGWMIVLAILAGGLTAVQGAFNAQLGRLLSHPLQATLISFAVGTLGAIVACLLLGTGFPTPAKLLAVPPWLLVGGLFGALFITATILFIPHIGVASMLVAALFGQILISLALDHAGLTGGAAVPLSATRILGALFVLAGLYLLTRPVA
jgi:bacterial/archaeal transporter family-2 protein